MENLTYPVQRVFFNSALTHEDVGVYVDSRKEQLMLSFKKLGITIPGQSGTTMPISAGGVSLPSHLSIRYSETQPAVKSAGLITLNNAAPCKDCDLSYYVSFRKEVARPLTDNSETNYVTRHYAGVIKRPSIVNGVLAENTLIAIEDDLITQIKNDKGVSKQLIDNNREAFVLAKRYYIIEDSQNNDATVLVIKTKTQTYTYTTTSPFDNLGAIVNAGGIFRATKISTSGTVTRYSLTSNDRGVLFTIDGTLCTDINVVSRSIYYESLSGDINAIPVVQNGFAEITPLAKHKFPYLTGDDVFRIFQNTKMTNFPTYYRLEQPNATDLWVKYTISVLYDTPSASDAASTYVKTKQVFEIYVNQNLYTKNIYSINDYIAKPKTWAYDTPYYPLDLSLWGLIQLWSGCTEQYWK